MAGEDAAADIINLAVRCGFTNCKHHDEPGCAVRVALKSGVLPASRLERYRKLKAEQVAKAPKQLKPGPTTARQAGGKRPRPPIPGPTAIGRTAKPSEHPSPATQ